MSTIRERFKLSALSIAVISSVSFNAFAAENEEADNNKKENEETEVIEIQGFRGSLAKSINDKRFSTNIADTINAEDIGKNTDQNIADALGRVTGVSIVNRDGEGSQITVRGATANQNNISLNGQQLTSTDFSQAVDLSSFSADILSRLEVIKTPSADHDEGSLGGSVNLVTARPLNQVKNTRSATLQARYNDFVDETDYKAQFSMTEKFLDDTFGVALTAYTETNSTRRDQYKAENFKASELIDTATDQNGDVVSGVRVIENTANAYELNLSDTTRSGLTLGLQWLPTDTSELTFDLTYSKEKKETSFDAIKTRSVGAQAKNLVRGEKPLSSYTEYTADKSDPQADWYTINTDTKTFIKKLDRFGAGDIARSEGGEDKDNLSASLKYELDISDDLRMSTQIGHSMSQSDSLPSAYTNMQNFVQVASPLLFEAGDAVQPVGYDCSTGKCEMVVGNAISDLGSELFEYTDENGEIQPGWRDNTNVLTGFNPADTKTFHLAFIQENAVKVEDKLSNAQVDFDYYVDFGPIISLEFGAKVTQREKFVDDQQFRFTSSTQTEVIEDEFGNKLVLPGGSFDGIRANMIEREGGIGYSDFMESLGYDRNGATTGWTPIDVFAARDLVLDEENTVPVVDNTKTRNTDIDTQAVYFKTNFELLDGRLTGDLGVRYVKTEVESSGFSGASFWSFDSEDLEREFDLVKLQELRDTSLPACQPLNGNEFGYEKKFQRVDGLGWDTSSGKDPSGWSRIPDQGPCHDPNFANWFELVNDNIPDADQTLPEMTWAEMWRYADVSTTHVHGWDASLTSPNITGEASGAFDYKGLTVANTQGKNKQSVASTNSHSYTNLLPSLNLNYAFSDELVGRFAISKTMTRPEIDQLRPGFSLNENGYWGGGLNNYGSSITGFNTQLEPLESNNLDFSLEWYFNPTSMLSVAYFRKDMSNFTDTNSDLTYIKDVRQFDEAGSLPLSEIVMLPDESQADSGYGLEGCMPVRSTALNFTPNDPLLMSDDLRDACARYQINQIVNGKGATINGLELGYSQTYDFLPGLLGGLGLSANYTYQDSEYDADVSSLTGEKLPTYPVADTPEHTYNLTTFWEQDGHQIRVSYRGSSDSLVGTDWNTGLKGRTWNQGSLWNEGRDSLDLSLAYQFNENISFTLQAINLTDEAYRTYFTSRTLEVQKVDADNPAGYSFVAYNEGNPLAGEAPKSRTYTKYKVGTTYRLGMRVNF